MIKHLTKKRNEEGFTLIELLVVVVILGILAAVVVFAVGGITNKGESAACKADSKTIRTAEEANYAKSGEYVDVATLKANGFLGELSTLHYVDTIVAKTATTPGSYKLKVTATGDCGTKDGEVGTGSNI